MQKTKIDSSQNPIKYHQHFTNTSHQINGDNQAANKIHLFKNREFSFGLEGYYTGVNIYQKRPTEEKFTYLATDTRSPYIDNQDMENGTQYYAYFILGDTEVGRQSNVVRVAV